jgi:hypothetical protein
MERGNSWAFLCLAALTLTACGSPGNSGTDAGTTAGTDGGGGGGGQDAGPAAYTLDECNQDLDRLANVGCGDGATWAQAKQSSCTKLGNAATALCEGALTKADQSHAQFQSAELFCNLGTADSNDPSAADVLMAVMCVATVNNGNCAGLSCQYNSDCPSDYSCNDATKKCFKKSSACIGLPCKYNMDCPTGLTCSDALGQCVRSSS